MNLTETYTSISKAVDITPVFATLNQANTIVDQLKGIDLPAIVIMPYEEVDSAQSETTKRLREAPLEAWVVTKIDKASLDADKLLIQEKAIEPMLLKARQFMKRLNASAIVRKDTTDGGIGRVVYRPLYSEFDALMFGVTISAASIPLNAPDTCLA